MERVAGSSPLNDEQQQHYADKHGIRFHAIGEQPFRDNRATRRAKRFGGRRGGSIDSAELQLARQAALKQLEQTQVKPT